jgi:subtilisin
MLGLLGVAPVASQAPDRLDVLIGFDRPPGAAQESLVRAFGGSIKHTYHLVPAIAANIPETAIAGLLRSQRVIRVELDGQFHAVDDLVPWGVGHIGASDVHFDCVPYNGGNCTGEGVSVAVIDSGIDYNHPDLYDNYVDGYDFVNDDAFPMDDNSHGTHVAGTIAAEYNGSGVVGVAPEASLYGLKVLNASGSGYFSDIIAALQWAVVNNIQVTNNSYGSSINPGSTVQAAFDNSAAAGVLHIAAAGNSGNPKGKGNKVIYPARWGSVVAVAATASSDIRASFSSTGPANELAAPGVGIYSTMPGGGYGTKSGTSMASPHVAGTAALIIAAGYVTSANDVHLTAR